MSFFSGWQLMLNVSYSYTTSQWMSIPAHWNFQAVSNMLKNIPFFDPHWISYYKFIFTYLESVKVMFLIRHTPLILFCSFFFQCKYHICSQIPVRSAIKKKNIWTLCGKFMLISDQKTGKFCFQHQGVLAFHFLSLWGCFTITLIGVNSLTFWG